MNRFKKHISFFLLLVSFAFIIPPELIHELTEHHDTIDQSCCSDDSFSVSTEHHHCSSLQTFVESYHASDQSVDFIEIYKLAPTFSISFFSVQFESADVLSNRGPPVSAITI